MIFLVGILFAITLGGIAFALTGGDEQTRKRVNAVAKPAGVNSVYRGFNGPTCEMARISAARGSGTDQGSQFKEVTFVLSDNGRQCIVQGWSWTTSKTGSSRQ